MQIKNNALVLSSDGKDVGHIRRVVIDPRNDQVRDLVVRKGKLFTEDRVVPMELVNESTDEQVRLKISAEVAGKLELFEETYYVPAGQEDPKLPPAALAPAYYWYPPMLGYEPTANTGAIPPELIGYELRRDRHIPANTVALKEGAEVKSRDDHHVGKVEQVITSPASGQATHIVVSEGVLNKTRKVIPLDWVGTIAENLVTLAVGESVVNRVPEYAH